MSQQTPTILDEGAHAKARAKLQQLIEQQAVKPFNADEWAGCDPESAHQTQEEIHAEVDDFLRLRQEWRAEEAKRARSID